MISVKVSKRLKCIAELINKGSVVYDVGSDHALLPCYLITNNICPKVYAGDNKEGPLNKAKENINKYQLNDLVIPILQDGIPDYIEDIDIISITGMGYYTIEKILDKANLNKYKYIIVESNSDVNLLRKYISDHNYKIIDEKIIYDDFYYQVIVFNTDYHETYDKLEIEYGPILLKRKDEIFYDYLLHQLNKINSINTGAYNKYDEKIAQIKKLLDKEGK